MPPDPQTPVIEAPPLPIEAPPVWDGRVAGGLAGALSAIAGSNVLGALGLIAGAIGSILSIVQGTIAQAQQLETIAETIRLEEAVRVLAREVGYLRRVNAEAAQAWSWAMDQLTRALSHELDAAKAAGERAVLAEARAQRAVNRLADDVWRNLASVYNDLVLRINRILTVTVPELEARAQELADWAHRAGRDEAIGWAQGQVARLDARIDAAVRELTGALGQLRAALEAAARALSEAIGQLRVGLAQEADARARADAQLSQALRHEAEARESVDAKIMAILAPLTAVVSGIGNFIRTEVEPCVPVHRELRQAYQLPDISPVILGLLVLLFPLVKISLLEMARDGPRIMAALPAAMGHVMRAGGRYTEMVRDP
jgi:hypothetical protein